MHKVSIEVRADATIKIRQALDPAYGFRVCQCRTLAPQVFFALAEQVLYILKQARPIVTVIIRTVGLVRALDRTLRLLHCERIALRPLPIWLPATALRTVAIRAAAGDNRGIMSQLEHPTEQSVKAIPVIGIVGGVGSGKSSVAKALAELVPVAIVDADRLGHQALELPGVQSQLRRRFGEAIFDAAGKVVRAELAKQVFGDSPAAVVARADLEAITHPEIGRLARAQQAGYRQANAVRWIVLDAALLLEANWRTFCDVVVFIDVPEELRIDRVRMQRGWSRAEWERREASQWPVARKRSAADVVISNAGDVRTAAAALQMELERRFPTRVS